ncbi:aldehyde dehydrogenase (NADP(+)) [Dactylosporangium sp. CA-233914]|uniref:aldehyde dehydrogenase (NADP(+)) n=1 Tax=Dactylosporangium sp. CA-233914 TaxID=3239934 RepID=UPI003D8A4C31
MTNVNSVDPRTGEILAVVGSETTDEQVDAICDRAAAAYRTIRERDRSWRSGLLRAMAEALEGRRDKVVETADAESALGAVRLNAELTRTCYQLRFFADVVDEGSFLEATIDHAGPTGMGPRPDLRRMLVATGPVVVFGASNFPLAFSVPGGDSASALAAGCPVVVKAHESHPATSQLCADILRDAAESVGAPDGTIGIVHGRAAGGRLVRHPAITAVAFTGSQRGGEALMELIDQRPSPIPFYGELGSVNPMVVTEAAAAERAADIGKGFADSFTLGVGQFCTKPGLAFVPAGRAGDAVVEATAAAIREKPAAVMLNAGIAAAFGRGVEEMTAGAGIVRVASGRSAQPGVAAQLLEVDEADLTDRMLEETFGPVAVVVRYHDPASLAPALNRLPSSLTATLQTGSGEPTLEPAAQRALEERAGRIVYNGFPTGVAVSWAQHHGGGWPATNSLHTSVGATAIRRFLRPLTWQDAPESALPVELRDATTGVPRRVDGVLVPASE